MTDDDTRGTHERVRAATTDTGTTPTMRRRALLATGATSLAAIAGCLDSGSDGDGANGGDDAAGNTTGTDPGDDGGNGSESPGNESADPGDDGDEEEPEPEPAPGPEALALEALVIGDGNTAQTRVATGTAVPATVAVTNTAEANVDGELVVRRDGSEVARESVTVSPGSTHDRTIDDVLGDVGTGTYDVTVAIAETDAAASGSVEVTDATDLTVTVRLADADGPPGGGGEVWAFPDEVPVSADTLATTGTGLEARELIDPFDRADIGADGTATVRAPADVDRAGLVVVAPGGGVFPPTDATVEIGAGVEQSVELVAGYPTQGADSFRFATYYYEPPAFREWFVWGTHAATDNQFTRWTDPGIRKETDRFGSVTEKISTFERDDRIHEWGDDLSGLGRPFNFLTRNWAQIDGERYFKNRGEAWEPNEFDWWYSPETNIHQPALQGLAGVTNLESDRQTFRRRETFDGRPVDVYNINFDAIEVDNKTYPDNEVYVDPETGRTVRVDTGRTVPDGEVAPEGFSISEFTGYDEHDELDFGDIPNIGSPV